MNLSTAIHGAGIVVGALGLYSLTQKRWGKGIALVLAGFSTHALARMQAAKELPPSQLGNLVFLP